MAIPQFCLCLHKYLPTQILCLRTDYVCLYISHRVSLLHVNSFAAGDYFFAPPSLSWRLERTAGPTRRPSPLARPADLNVTSVLTYWLDALFYVSILHLLWMIIAWFGSMTTARCNYSYWVAMRCPRGLRLFWPRAWCGICLGRDTSWRCRAQVSANYLFDWLKVKAARYSCLRHLQWRPLTRW